MLATILLLITLAQPSIRPQPGEWVLELTVTAAGREFKLRMPAGSYLQCEELRDTWLVDGPRDREGFRSEVDCLPRAEIEQNTRRHR